MDNWFDVKDSMPLVGDPVLVLLEGETILRGRLHSNGWSAFFADGEKLTGSRVVTHWTYLPSFPWEKKDTSKLSQLTNREYFASMALQGLLANGQLINTQTATQSGWREDISITARMLADALIAELSKPQP